MVAKKLQAAVEANDTEMALRVIDFDNLIRHSLPEHLKDTQQGKEIVAGAQSGFGGLVRELHAGDYQFLRASEIPDGAQAMMRLTPPNGGVNYHRLVLGRNAQNEACVVDIFVYISGEPLSHTFGRLFAQLMPNTKSPDAKAMQALKQAQDMAVALQKGDPAHALAIYDGMPPKWQRQKTIMQTRIMAANKVAISNVQKGQPAGDDYRKAVKDFQQAFPNAENLALVLIDLYFFNEDFKQARAAVDQLDKQVGGDPFLNLLRGNIALAQGKKQAGKDFYTQLIKDIPKNAAPYISLIELALADKDFKAPMVYAGKQSSPIIPNAKDSLRNKCFWKRAGSQSNSWSCMPIRILKIYQDQKSQKMLWWDGTPGTRREFLLKLLSREFLKQGAMP